jgi:nucleotidyltransferase substrate binding protein (TIGR01987 family)
MTHHLAYKFIEQLKALSFVDEIWLFGSRARGDNQERSDIDLAIVCPAASDTDWLKVVNIIENADTLLKIDCVRFRQNPNKQVRKSLILVLRMIFIIILCVIKRLYMLKAQIKFERFEKVLTALEAIYLKPVQADRANIDATIQRFEFTFELAWKFLKEYFFEQGLELNYPREVIKEAFAVRLIDDEGVWLGMLKDRNMTSHTYNEMLADEIYVRIKLYVPLLHELLMRVKW